MSSAESDTANGCYRFFKVIHFAGADYGRRNAGLVKHPGQSNLGRRDVSLLGHLHHSFDNLEVAVSVIHAVGHQSDLERTVSPHS